VAEEGSVRAIYKKQITYALTVYGHLANTVSFCLSYSRDPTSSSPPAPVTGWVRYTSSVSFSSSSTTRDSISSTSSFSSTRDRDGKPFRASYKVHGEGKRFGGQGDDEVKKSIFYRLNISKVSANEEGEVAT